MSKLMKNVIAIVMAITLVLPGLTAFANPARDVYMPDHFFPGFAEDGSAMWDEEYGSLTIVRTAGPEVGSNDAPGVGISPAHQRIPGVPIRIVRVTLDANAVPNAANLASETWIAANTTETDDVFYGVTDANGEVSFPGLELGIWLVRELPSLTVTAGMEGVNLPAVGTTVTNPVNSTPNNDGDGPFRFENFLVAIPNFRPTVPTDYPCTNANHPNHGVTGCLDYIERESGWIFDVRVYPKNERPVYDNTKLLTNIDGDLATWTLTHQIPNAVQTLPYFSVEDIMSSGLSWNDVVRVRFTTAIAAVPTGEYDVNDDPIYEYVHTFTYLTRNTHFTAVAMTYANGFDPAYNGLYIQFTQAGLDAMANPPLGTGVAIDGRIEVEVESIVNTPGAHSNVAQWRVGVPRELCPDIPDPVNPGDYIPDPDCEYTPPPCPPTDPDCDEVCPEQDPDCDADYDWFYSFILELLKVNQADQGLEGALFGIYREVQLTAVQLEAFEYDGTLPAGVYYTGEADDDDNPIFVTASYNADGQRVQGTTDADGITRFTNADPTVLASGSGDGTNPALQIHNLWLREITPPEGYAILQEFMPIRLSASTARQNSGTPDLCESFDVETTPGNYLEIPCHEDGGFWFIVDVEVLNLPEGGWVLPDTGGMGTVVLTVAGIGLVGGSLFMFVSSKNDDEDEELDFI